MTKSPPTVSLAEGWAIVPVEPTEAMIDRFVSRALCVSVHGDGGWSNYAREQWSAMLAASPAHTPAPDTRLPERETLKSLDPLPDELARAAAIGWIDTNFGLLSGKSSATDRLIACFMGGLQVSWDNVRVELAAYTPHPAVEVTEKRAPLADSLRTWRNNLAITRDSPMIGDPLSGASLNFVIEQIDELLAASASTTEDGA